MARRKQRSRRSTYKRQRAHNWRDRSDELTPAPVRRLSLEDLPPDSALRRLATDDTDTAQRPGSR